MLFMRRESITFSFSWSCLSTCVSLMAFGKLCFYCLARARSLAKFISYGILLLNCIMTKRSHSLWRHTHTHTYALESWTYDTMSAPIRSTLEHESRINAAQPFLKIRNNSAHTKHFRNKTKHQVVARIRTRFISSRALIAKQPILLLETMMNEMHVKPNLRLPSP